MTEREDNKSACAGKNHSPNPSHHLKSHPVLPVLKNSPLSAFPPMQRDVVDPGKDDRVIGDDGGARPLVGLGAGWMIGPDTGTDTGFDGPRRAPRQGG